MSTPHDGEGQGSDDRGPRHGVPPVPGRAPETANRTPLIVVGVAVIAVCVVVLFALGGGGPASTPLQAGDCVPAESDGVVPCDDADAAYRVVELREDVLAAAAPAACAEVPGVVAYGWQGAEDRPGTALCLGPA